MHNFAAAIVVLRKLSKLALVQYSIDTMTRIKSNNILVIRQSYVIKWRKFKKKFSGVKTEFKIGLGLFNIGINIFLLLVKFILKTGLPGTRLRRETYLKAAFHLRVFHTHVST